MAADNKSLSNNTCMYRKGEILRLHKYIASEH